MCGVGQWRDRDRESPIVLIPPTWLFWHRPVALGPAGEAQPGAAAQRLGQAALLSPGVAPAERCKGAAGALLNTSNSGERAAQQGLDLPMWDPRSPAEVADRANL